MRGFAIIRMAGGQPDLSDANGEPLPYYGYSLAGHIGQNWGLYIISGTAAQLSAINALSQVYGICAISHSGAIHLAAGLDAAIPAAVRTRLNTWLSARGYPVIPAGWTYRQVIVAIYKRVNDRFDLEHLDIQDPD